MPPTAGISIECSVAEANNEERLQRDLRTQRNALVRICQLPPEILSLIFVTYAKNDDVRYHHRHPLSWIRISHVCRRFRAVALESPALWSNIYLGSLPIAREMLKRSKGAEIVLSSQTLGSKAGSGQAVKEALVQMDRIHTVELDILSNSELDAVVASLKADAPRLQVLILHKRFETLSPNTDASYRSLPPNFLWGGAPQLRYLGLVDCVLPWRHWQGVPNRLKPCLTVLELVETSSPPSGQKPSLSQLLDLLEASPALQILDLHNTLPIAANTIAAVPFPERVVSLPQLDELRLAGTYLQMIGLLRAVSFSKTTAVKVVGDSQNEWLDACSALMLTLSKSRGSAFTPERICVHQFNPSSPSFWIWAWDKSAQSNFKTIQRDLPSLDVWIRYRSQFPVPPLSATDMSRSIFGAMDFSQLQTLEVSPHVKKMVWGCFGDAPNLTHILASKGSAKGLAEAMIPRLSVGTLEQVRSEMHFHALQHVSLERVDFRGADFDAEAFTDTLMLRAAYGSDLHLLSIQGSPRITKLHFEAMEEVVAIFDWDGKGDEEDYYISSD